MADTWEEEVRQKLRCGEAMEAMKAAGAVRRRVQCEEKGNFYSNYYYKIIVISL